MTVIDKWVVTLPDLNEQAELESFVNYLKINTDKRGVKTLLIQLKRYMKHRSSAAIFDDKIKAAALYVNGVGRGRPPINKQMKTVKKYYESLNTAGLRLQCKVYDVDYDSYETQEEIIAKLVEKHAEMAS